MAVGSLVFPQIESGKFSPIHRVCRWRGFNAKFVGHNDKSTDQNQTNGSTITIGYHIFSRDTDVDLV